MRKDLKALKELNKQGDVDNDMSLTTDNENKQSKIITFRCRLSGFDPLNMPLLVTKIDVLLTLFYNILILFILFFALLATLAYVS